MAVDWGTTGGDALSGAASGFLAGGPVGAAIGGVGGLLSGLLSGPKQTPHFDDPNAWQRDYASRQLLTSNIGAKQAAGAAGQEMNFARDQAEEAANNPNLAGNAAAQAGIRNKLLTGAQRGAQSAYLHGAEVDSENKVRGAQIAGESSRIAQSYQQMNQGYADRPTFGEQMLKTGLSTATGLGLSALTKKADPGDTTDNGNADSPQSTYVDKLGAGQTPTLNYQPQNLNLADSSVYGSQKSYSDPSWNGLFDDNNNVIGPKNITSDPGSYDYNSNVAP